MNHKHTGTCGEIDTKNMNKIINYIKLHHRSTDTLEEWTKNNLYKDFDVYQSQVYPYLARLDEHHQEQLYERVKNTNICTDINSMKYSIPNIDVEYLKNDKKLTIDTALKYLENSKNINEPAFISSIDRWPANLLTQDLCKKLYQDRNLPVIIRNIRDVLEDDNNINIDDIKYNSTTTKEVDTIEKDNNSVDTVKNKAVNIKVADTVEKDNNSVDTIKNKAVNIKEIDTIENAKYPAHFWNLKYLMNSEFANATFRIGEDDDGKPLRTQLKLYLQYLQTTKDCSPLYLFEDNLYHSKITSKIVKLYRIPPYFEKDLITDVLSETERPPYKWLIIGGKRSGTRAHLDPRNTSAWNLNVYGIKHWVLFRPGVPIQVAKAHVVATKDEQEERYEKGNPQASYYFVHLLPRLRSWISMRERHRYNKLLSIYNYIYKNKDKNDNIIPKSLRKYKYNEYKEIIDTCYDNIYKSRPYDINNGCTSDLCIDFDINIKKLGKILKLLLSKSYLNEKQLTCEERYCLSYIKKPNKWNELRDGYGYQEFYQYPGDLIFVPSRYYHAVVNVTDTIAFTQNFTTHSNFISVWRHMRRQCKRTARRCYLHMKQIAPEYSNILDLLDKYDEYKLSYFKPSSNFLNEQKDKDTIDMVTYDIPSSSDSDITPSSESDGYYDWEPDELTCNDE